MIKFNKTGNMLALIAIVLAANTQSTYGQGYLITWENSLARTLENRLLLNETEHPHIFNEQNDQNDTKIIVYKNTLVEKNQNELSQTAMDVITIIWYVATFMALAAFFMLMACSDRRCRDPQSIHNGNNNEMPMPPPTPSPSYSEFAPPSYETVIKMQHAAAQHTSIFVIPFASMEMAKDDANINDNNNTNTINSSSTPPPPPPAVNVYTVNELQKI